ncbi:NACHT, LRR and PYD domains-containing protein 5 isoform X2 [Selaginella moellendorffii]|uniref:NACHT, LRR and PYD domains-containing protein 5 isoform X2 n=1 Tax=Selaginella moellendorffii TaxID=88036 RepID=UPI000D1CC9DA|nr:NACHT, LRR and PYD domains-containing protein 5 isoform X2 [Selaginella moellendorffii]|eukprot:XP_024524973.1 NACHT, LRR and PYD domains-containing protein 5 isoform X2 [Selaginella moellendorffii]
MVPARAPMLLDVCCSRMAAILSEDFSAQAQTLDLPLDLLCKILLELPPLPLHYLEQCASGQYEEGFSLAWKSLAECHHNTLLKHGTWKDAYWEAHVQACLNAVTTKLAAPNFDGQIGDLLVPEALVYRIGARNAACCEDSDFTSLKNTIPLLSRYVKSLRLRSVLCSSELLSLFDSAELASLSFLNIKTSTQFGLIINLLARNVRALRRLEFHYCKFFEQDFNTLLGMLKSADVLSDFAITCSSIQVPWASLEMQQFLRSCRSLACVHLVSNRMHTQFTSSIVVELFSLSSLDTLDFADNLLESCFESPTVNQFFINCAVKQLPFTPGLKVLNLKSCFLSSACVQNLVHYLKCLPHLHTLNLSDNPVADEGIKSVACCLQTSLSALMELNVAGCELSWNGLSSLLDSLVSTNHRLRSLSVADNSFGRSGSAVLAKYLQKSAVKELDISEIGLGSLGCSSELASALIQNQTLEHLNISKNRIAFPGAELLHAVISKGQGVLTDINASFNLLNVEAMKRLASALQTKAALGRMKRLDLLGNPGIPPPGANLFGSFSEGPDAIVLLSSSQFYVPLHDDDP